MFWRRSAAAHHQGHIDHFALGWHGVFQNRLHRTLRDLGKGCATVVRPGSTMPPSGTPSKPMIETSPGTVSPRAASQLMASNAILSDIARMAVGGFGAENRCSRHVSTLVLSLLVS